MISRIFFLFIFVSYFAFNNAQASSNVTITLSGYGQVIGTQTNGNAAFLGIPFAKPPVGNLRFTVPQPPTPWSKPILANKYPTRCTQIDYEFAGPIVGGEDCLYMNVWAPATPPPHGQSYPILVYVMGGGFNFYAYQYGDKLAANSPNTIVIIFHYRLNVFSYISSPGLSASNFGLYDIVQALKFIKSTVAPALHGDVNRITVSGESAGSIQVCHLLVSPLAKGLFTRAVMESGGCDLPVPAPSARYGYVSNLVNNQYFILVTGVNCTNLNPSDTIACLRTVDAVRLETAVLYSGYNNFGTIVLDGTIVVGQPATLFAQGKALNVPMLLGSTRDEYGYYQAYSSAAFASYTWSYVSSALPNNTLVNNYYNQANTLFKNVPANAYVNYNSAFIFQCPILRTARYLTNQRNNVWLYSWEYNTGRGYFSPFGVVHSSSLPFWFSNADSNEDAKLLTGATAINNYTAGGYLTANEISLSRTFQQYLLRFVHNANPNNPAKVRISGASGNIPYWPEYQEPPTRGVTDSDYENYLTYSGYASAGISYSIKYGYHVTECDIQEQLLNLTTLRPCDQ